MSLPLPVPCAAHPDGHPGFGHGADLPDGLQQALRGDTLWAHAVQPGKQDWFALAVMYWLNGLAAGPGRRPIRLLVSESSLAPHVRDALDAMLPHGQHWHDYLVPVPNLNQRALFQLMRACRFGLAYNNFPEPFGFYVLESIHCGCPVCTNGAGNYRHVLPEGHRLTVLETPAMAPMPGGERDPAAYRVVAERILADLAHTDTVAADCERGAAMVRERWNLQTFEQALVAALDRLDQAPAEPPVFERMRIVVGPLVRSLDTASGRCLGDYASTTLSAEAAATVARLVGTRCDQLETATMEELECRHGLFAQGVLSLAADVPGFAPAADALA